MAQGDVAAKLAGAQDNPRFLVADGASVYWTNELGGTVMMAPKGGGAPVILASGQGSPFGVAVDGTHVYWANHGGGTVMKLALAGSAPVTPGTRGE